MPWYLKSGTEIIAELGPELSGPGADTRSWPLQPTPRFEKIRPLVAAMNEMQNDPFPKLPAEFAGIEDVRERGLAIQSWLRSDPQAQNRTRLHEQFRSLELLITDETGAPLPGTVSIAQVPPPSVPFSSKMRPDFEKRGFPGGPPFYMVVASPTPASSAV